jgi:CdiI immunity protein
MKRLEALRALLDCYLHEDWADDYADLWHAVDDFTDGEPNWAPRFAADVRQVLDQCHTEPEIEQLLNRLGMVYYPLGDGWSSYRTWLLAVAAHVEKNLHKTPAA